jgi:hypothetical protein
MLWTGAWAQTLDLHTIQGSRPPLS